MQMKDKLIFRNLLGLFFLSFSLVSCFSSDNPSAQRAERLRQGQGPIIIGAVSNWLESDGMQEKGIKLAVAEINDSGGILGRKLKLVFADDNASVATAQIVAQKFADNLDMVAVIGHTHSYISIPVSIIYEYYGLLMMSPLSTSPKLTQRNFKLIFRNIPDDVAYGVELAHFCQRRGLKRVLIYHIKNDYGTGLANAFENECRMVAVEIVDRAAYNRFSDVTILREQLAFWQRNYKFDTIFLAGEMPDAAEIVKCARELGIAAVILGDDFLDNAEFIKNSGSAAEGVIIPSVFAADNRLPSVVDFVQKFKKKYNKTPSYFAEQGYDSVKVLVQAINDAKTTEPFKIAAALRSGNVWQGVTDNYSFDMHGDVVGRKIFLKIVKDGDFVFLSD